MNEIELVAYVDRLAKDFGSLPYVEAISSDLTEREAEIMTAELKRRGTKITVRLPRMTKENP